jgi:hypothetical protein
MTVWTLLLPLTFIFVLPLSSIGWQSHFSPRHVSGSKRNVNKTILAQILPRQSESQVRTAQLRCSDSTTYCSNVSDGVLGVAPNTNPSFWNFFDSSTASIIMINLTNLFTVNDCTVGQATGQSF